MASICVLGTGYVGLCTGLVFAQRGHEVTFVDVDAAKLALVERGEAPFFEPGVGTLLASLRGAFRTTTQLDKAVATSAFTFLCVGTPKTESGAIDLGQVRQAAGDVGRALRTAARGHVVVVKSTVVPGTAEKVVVPELEAASGLREGRDFHVASNPEFLKEGSALHDAQQPDRVVVGARSSDAARAVHELYAWASTKRVSVTPTTAEMIKYAANAFLATKIAFANEMANLCERDGVDWYDVVEGIGPDPRIGPLFLRAGVGYGGSCFPKDVAALAEHARAVGAPSKLLETVLEHNERQALEAVRMLDEELGNLRGRTVALLGLAFKPQTDDVRETRAAPLHDAMVARGARVVCHDPLAGPNFRRLRPHAEVAPSLEDALRGADACVIQTEWEEYRTMPFGKVLEWMRSPIVVDGRRTLDPRAAKASGVRYRAIGLGHGE